MLIPTASTTAFTSAAVPLMPVIATAPTLTEVLPSSAVSTVAAATPASSVIVSASFASPLASAVFSVAATPAVTVAVTTPLVAPAIVLTSAAATDGSVTTTATLEAMSILSPEAPSLVPINKIASAADPKVEVTFVASINADVRSSKAFKRARDNVVSLKRITSFISPESDAIDSA